MRVETSAAAFDRATLPDGERASAVLGLERGRPIFSVTVCLGALALIALAADELRPDLKWRNYAESWLHGLLGRRVARAALIGADEADGGGPVTGGC